MQLNLKVDDPKGYLGSFWSNMSARIAPVMEKAMGLALVVAQGKIQDNLTGPILNVRTNRLRSSFVTRVENKNGTVYGNIGSNVVYAAIHEFGGTILGNPLLQFQLEGRWVTVKSVVMPARKYLSISLEQATPEMREQFVLAMKFLARVGA